jgi:AcrR family transcriptional regulator
METDVTDTKTRILDVAERLFAAQGLDRVSIRDITEAAHVNLAAINYHFGSKEDLISAVFQRRIKPVNEDRIAAIDAATKIAGDKPASVETILEAFVRPALRCTLESADNGRSFATLFGRCLSETHPELENLLTKEFEPVMDRMISALCKALPHLTRSEIFWRLKFTFGALHHLLLTKDRCVPGWAAGVTVEEQMKKLVSFAAAGFCAP